MAVSCCAFTLEEAKIKGRPINRFILSIIVLFVSIKFNFLCAEDIMALTALKSKNRGSGHNKPGMLL
jgi:hypothetical protein